MSSPTKSKSKSKATSEESHCFASFTTSSDIIATTTPEFPGYRIKRIYGTVYGLSIRSRKLGADIASLMKATVDGELRYFTTMMYTARDHVVERMIGGVLEEGQMQSLHLEWIVRRLGVCTGLCLWDCGFG